MSLEDHGYTLENMQITSVFNDLDLDKKLVEYQFNFPDQQINIPKYFLLKDDVDALDQNKKINLIRLLNQSIKNNIPLSQSKIDQFISSFHNEDELT